MNLGLTMLNYKNLGYWKLWYRYHYVWYRYQTHSVSWYRYHLSWYRYQMGSVKGYRYHPILVPVPPRGLPRIVDFCPLLVPLSSIQLLNSLIPQEPTWNSSKNTQQHLYWWFGISYNQTLGKIQRILPKVHQFLQNHINRRIPC